MNLLLKKLLISFIFIAEISCPTLVAGQEKCAGWQPSRYRETELFYITYRGKRLDCLWNQDDVIECGQSVRISIIDTEEGFQSGVGAGTQSGIKKLNLVDSKGQLFFFNRKQSYHNNYFPNDCSYIATTYTTEFEDNSKYIMKIIWERRFGTFKEGEPLLH
ncbi:hypothetical protein IQ276_039125 [Desmonostoc muscorum LEGE 12446]|uniref:Uncharacterized protein n=1 Tax=Desmonostoc muscorum LEGE 12446 TaxID=1828758 RepID=A0A8J6ZLR2_DESMC|nr:hypothetical protein [Desmonostoc muscorum]MCF2152299.1 hypothetical protein [Desmonostoc muscorum LEGE 12446]